MNQGIWLSGPDMVIESRAKAAKLAVCVQTEMDGRLPFEKTLITEPGVRVPFDLLPAAWHFLDRWDAAIPLWRYGALAAEAGTLAERAATEAIIRDLRVLLHAVELLFVRDNEAGNALVTAWRQEMETGDDKRLAFLRAMYQVKPRLCVLPTSWLAGVARQPAYPVRIVKPSSGPPARRLVTVEIAPGRFVKIREGDEDRARAQFERQQAARYTRRQDDDVE